MAELDFELEAKNIRRFQANLLITGCSIPEGIREIFDGFSALHGNGRHQYSGCRYVGFDMQLVGDRYRVAYDMLFEHGFFPWDLHPGNVLVLKEDPGILDCGMVGQLTREMKDQVIGLTFALRQGDHRTLARIFIRLPSGRTCRLRSFRAGLRHCMERHYSWKIWRIGIWEFFMDIAQRVYGTAYGRARRSP